MKTKLFYLLTSLVISLGIKAQVVNFPDPNFKAALMLSSPTQSIAKDMNGNWVKIDANNDGEIQQSEADNISYLFAGNYFNTQSLEGIKSFRNATELLLQGSSLASIDLSNMTNVVSVIAGGTSATSINLSGMTNLESLQCSSNQFTILDLSGLNKLKLLVANYGSLSSIIFPTSGVLEGISLSNNHLTTLDLSQQTQLNVLNCSENQISNINVVGLNKLEWISVDKNQLTDLNLFGCVNLVNLYCSDNSLTTLDISNKPNLKNVYSGLNQLETLNINNSTNIEYLDLYRNKLTGFLDLSSLHKVLGISVSKNLITKLDASNGKYHNDMGSNNYLNIRDNPNLETLILKNLSTDAYIEGIFESTGLANLPSLKYICSDENKMIDFDYVITLQNLKKIMLVSDCNFTLNCTQNITIPDANFKQYLVENFDYNNNGEICDAEAEKVLFIKCPNLNISSVEGLNSFKNVWHLNVSQNHIQNLDISDLKALTRLNCTYNNLTELNTSENIKLYELNFNNNPPLQKLFIKNGADQYISNYVSPTEIYSDTTFLNTNINYVCADDTELEMVKAILVHEGKNASVSSYCTSSPGGNYNTITGTIRFDENNNGCDTADEIFEHLKLKINDGITIGETFVKQDGTYSFYTQSGNFTVTAEAENPSLFTVTPPSFTTNFADNNNNIFTKNICITKNGNAKDLEIIVAPIINARPGFDAVYKLIWRNKGNTTLSGSAILIFDNSRMTFVSSTLPSTVSGDQVVFNFNNLKPYENSASEIQFIINPPTHPLNPVNNGDILNFTANITPISGDLNPDDNSFNYNETVVGSYDPNDITCLEGNQIPVAMVGKDLHYIVNFENTGTASAVNIVVEMDINPDDFDINTLQLQNTSHNTYTKITGNKAEFIMKDINLAALAHGNIALKIKSKNNLVSGDTVMNKANIYFDYNYPVETNEAITNIGSTTLSASDMIKGKETLNVYPNPTKDDVNISSDSKIRSVEIYDAQGRIIQKQNMNSEKTIISLHNNTSGLYIFKIKTEKETVIKKVIKN